MTKNPDGDYFLEVKFYLKADKQRKLMDYLLVASGRSKFELAKLLDLPLDSVLDTLSGKILLKKDEAERLVEYFCLCIGA